MQFVWWLLTIAVSLGAALWVFRADKKRSIPMPWLTAILRGALVAAACMLLVVPDSVNTRYETEKPVVLFLHDNSVSAGRALGTDSAAYRQNIEALAAKLSDKYRVMHRAFGDRMSTDSLYSYHMQATDISSALSAAGELTGIDDAAAVILATDGIFNAGVSPAWAQIPWQGPLFTIGIGDSTREKDIRLSRVYANKTATLNSTFEVRADVLAALCRGYNGTLSLMEGNETVASSAVPVNSDRFDRSFSFAVKAEKAGLHHYTLVLTTADGEQNITNNRRDVFVEVADVRRKILIVANAPHPDITALRDALTSSDIYEVKTVNADAGNISFAGYDALILHGLPSMRNRMANAIAAAHIPFWLIATRHTDIAAVNTLKQITHAGVAQGNGAEQVVNFHTAFNAFTPPLRIQTVTDKLPPLTTWMGNVMAAPGSDILFTRRTAAGVMPAWVMQHGETPTAILAGEGIWRWRLYEFRNTGGHDIIDECIRQTVAFLCTGKSGKPFEVTMPRRVWSDQEPVSFDATLLNASNERINTADVQLVIKDSAGRTQKFSMERSGTGYNINTGIHAGGRYSWTATTTYDGKEQKTSGSFVVESVPLELMNTTADFSLLYNLAHRAGGSFVTTSGIPSLYDSVSSNSALKPVIITHAETVPLIQRKWYFIILLAIAVAEWLIRKYWLAQ